MTATLFLLDPSVTSRELKETYFYIIVNSDLSVPKEMLVKVKGSNERNMDLVELRTRA